MVPLVSVLIPAFNRPTALAVTLTSRVAQTFRDFRVVIANMLQAIQAEGCGFVGSALAGLSYQVDVRPREQAIEFGEGQVEPEAVRPGSPAWDRHKLHNAANIYHVTQRLHLSPGAPRRYKVAWVGGLIPSGVYHLELPTTIPNRPVDAPKYLKIEVKKNEPD